MQNDKLSKSEVILTSVETTTIGLERSNYHEHFDYVVQDINA